MLSCLYTGQVVHRRWQPLEHGFKFRLHMAYLDLSEISALTASSGPLSAARCAPASFQAEDHVGEGEKPLDECVREAVAAETGWRPSGPIRLLTQLRYFGHYFSPLNLFFCFSNDGLEVEAIAAEVSNTPWGERHLYVLWEGNRSEANGTLRYDHAKQFHVSPFMGMDVD